MSAEFSDAWESPDDEEASERHLREVGFYRRPCDGKPLGEFLEFDVISETGSWM